ncbi:MAG: hypothetical protein GF364_08785 [Candidatus Lokiarchaeota archaeon]|nr:hypothetical protein [Candidatus Lokiarchaeota archaeon]
MSKYGQVAIDAARAARKGASPVDAWKEAAHRMFPTQKASRDKGCPKCAFLGLAEDGLIKGVPRGSYTNSADNKRYAVNAVGQIRANANLLNDKRTLWKLVSGGAKQHNGQIDVVVDLWNNDDI